MSSDELGEGRHCEDADEDVQDVLYACVVLRSGDLAHDECPADRQRIDHREMQLPPECGHPEETREEGGVARRPQGECGEEGDEVDVCAAMQILQGAPREVEAEERDHREGDGERRGVDRVGEGDVLHELRRRADLKVVDAPTPPHIRRVQEDREPPSCRLVVERYIVDRAAARFHAPRPVAVAVEEVVIEVDGDILIRRGKEQVAVYEQRGIRNLPRKVDRRCIRWQWRRDGIVIGLPVERVSAKVAKHRGGRIREGIRGGKLTVGGRCEETP